VCDPGDSVADNPNRFWSQSFDAGAVTGGLRPYTGNIGTVTRFTGWDLGVSGRVTSVTVVGTGGTAVIEGWDIRTGLSLRDTRFAVNRNLNITGPIRDGYDRLRCRPGRATSPSQKIPGGRLQTFAVGRMYQHARRDRVVWLRGPVLARYIDLGEHTSELRLPYRFASIQGGQRGWFDGGIITCAGGCRVRYT
jgi:hypothetical protein